ncbi:MAG: ribonuclease [Sideroxydans sp.]
MLRGGKAWWWIVAVLALVLSLAQARNLTSPPSVPGSPVESSQQDVGIEAAGTSIKLAQLPPEARATLRLIRQGGPFPYARDGVVFGNYEHRLPPQARGYYHEYTVPTPGVRHRGARRIVCGERHECYYSPDHYRTFRRIEEDR